MENAGSGSHGNGTSENCGELMANNKIALQELGVFNALVAGPKGDRNDDACADQPFQPRCSHTFILAFSLRLLLSIQV